MVRQWRYQCWGTADFARGVVETVAEPVRVICDIPKYVYADRECNEANMRLIAAAPDLLDIAVTAEEYLAGILGDCIPECECILHPLRAALTKATGDSRYGENT